MKSIVSIDTLTKYKTNKVIKFITLIYCVFYVRILYIKKGKIAN